MISEPPIGAQASELTRDLTLNSPSEPEAKLPKLIYGTAWKTERTADLVYKALKNGFRAIDTAAQPQHYDEEGAGTGIRRAIGEGIIAREDLFIQTKYTPALKQRDMAPYDTDAPLELQVRQSVESSLHNFTIQGHGPPYIDCLILHVPLETHDDMMTVWKTLESYVPDKVRHLGISNVTLNGLRVLMMSVNIKPAVVQNPWCRQTGYAIELREFCMEQGIIFQAFWTLSANHHLARGEHVRKLADSAGVSHPSAYYSLVLGLGNISILDGTTSEQHMKEDLAGIEKVGAYADGSGRTAWLEAQTNFKRAVRY